MQASYPEFLNCYAYYIASEIKGLNKVGPANSTFYKAYLYTFIIPFNSKAFGSYGLPVNGKQ